MGALVDITLENGSVITARPVSLSIRLLDEGRYYLSELYRETATGKPYVSEREFENVKELKEYLSTKDAG